MKQKLGGIIYCILQGIVGVLLLIDPVKFTSVIFIVLGALLTVMGVVNIVKYFRAPVNEAAKSHALTRGLLMALIGVFCMFRTGWLIATFPIIAVLYGVMMLVIGVSKVQSVMDAVRRKENWFWTLISAVITLICAAVVILNPFSSTVALWVFTGIALIVDAVFDLVALIFAKSSGREAADGEAAA